MPVWTIQKILPVAQGYLAEKGLAGAARLEAELLLAQVLACDRVYLFTHFERLLQEDELAAYRAVLKRRAAHEPVAYILGWKEFMSLRFEVNPQVLIPRPETELMVELALDYLKLRGGGTLCDVGAGSGAVAVAVGHHAKVPVTLTGLDISAAALAVAKKNAKHLKVEAEWQVSDLFQALAPERIFTVITANLPYVGTKEYESLPREVREYEPKLALTAGSDGMDLYRRLAREALTHLSRDSILLMEISPHQTELLPEVLGEAYEWRVLKDLSGRDRLVEAKLA